MRSSEWAIIAATVAVAFGNWQWAQNKDGR